MFDRVIIALFIILATVDLWRQQYFINSYYHLKKVLSTHKTIILLMPILGCVIIAIVDIPIAHFAKNHLNIARLAIFSKLSLLADGLYLVPTLVITIAMLNKLQQVIANHNLKQRLQKLILVLQISFTALISSGIINGVLKVIFSRQRPIIGFNNWSLFSILYNPHCHLKGLSYSYNSLPSGHTIIITALILPILWAYQNNIWLKCLLIAYYLLIIFCRIYTLNHWSSDVFLASCLGYIIAKICYQGNANKLSNYYEL